MPESVKNKLNQGLKMLLVKRVIFPILSLLVISCTSTQQGWIEIGYENGARYQMNPEVQRSGSDSSVVTYELWITRPLQAEKVRFIKAQMVARCKTRSQIFSHLEVFNLVGRSIKAFNYDIANSTGWETPKRDIFIKAFNTACNVP